MAEADGLLWRTFARRCGVYLALAAVTLQLALSFGHVHRHDLAYPNVAYSKIDVVTSRLAPTRLEISKQLPPTLADDDDHCLICFSTLLLASSFMPDAPQHSPSSDFKDVYRFGRTFDIVFGQGRAPFQSRAPPLR